MLLMLVDERAAGRERWIWAAFAIAVMLVSIGSIERTEVETAVVLPPAPVEQTLDIRTLVQPERDDQRANVGPRSDI
jgi:hypothetical protein